MKRDEEMHRKRYLEWKRRYKNRIPEITKENSDIILRYISDMEYGLNVSNKSKKGGRGYAHLYSLQQRMILLAKRFEKLYETTDITKLDERVLHDYFTKIRNGDIKKDDGKPYLDPANIVKTVKAFWHWWIKINRKQDIKIYDITQDLDTSKQKPKWVYLTEKDIRKLYDQSIYYYKALIMFLFDTGVRAPSELTNIKVSDFYNDFKEVEVRDEVSKTFGRRIKLMISSEIIKNFIEFEKLGPSDFVFNRRPSTMNQYLQRLAKKVLGEEKSEAGRRYSEISMYDFRHCSCCYWLPRYKSESALKYRFGWKKSDKIHYYSELLGMCDTITEEDMLIDTTMTEMQKKLIKTERQKEVFTERIEILEQQMKAISQLIKETRFIKNIPNTQQ
ncbi:tyrosine-type recombinase/integrase [Candidatus Pacearchaeota archaeon]|nr:tyrosine-type recombinase/integrase [Candidatus Pacearchaeota archaeon]